LNKVDNEEYDWPADLPASTGHASDHELTAAYAAYAQEPNPKKRPFPDADPDFDWYGWMTKPSPPRQRPMPPKEFSQADEYQPEVEHVYYYSSPDAPSIETLTDEEEFGVISTDDVLSQPMPGSSKGLGHHEYQVAHILDSSYPTLLDDADSGSHYSTHVENLPPLRQASARPSDPRPVDTGPSNTGPSNTGPSNTGPSNTEPSNPELPTEPEPHPDEQPSSVDPEWDAAQAARYAAKGKAKQMRRISGTARDVGNEGSHSMLKGRLPVIAGGSKFLSSPSTLKHTF
jgi:hypothetical protein